MARPTASDVLAEARKHIGDRERPPGSNRTKFGNAYGWNGVAWCQIWIWYILRAVGGSDLILKTAGCREAWDWFEARGATTRTRANARPGALIYFGQDASKHVGIVEKAERGRVTYISGNTPRTAGGPADSVWRNTIPANDPDIWGYAFPEYARERELTPHEKHVAHEKHLRRIRRVPGYRPPRRPKTRIIRVRRGQTLGGIAALVGITLSALLAFNPNYRDNPDHIEPGDRVTVPVRS